MLAETTRRSRTEKTPVSARRRSPESSTLTETRVASAASVTSTAASRGAAAGGASGEARACTQWVA
jgi:hypothetical protein